MVHFVGCQGVACRALMIGSPRCSRGWTNGNRQTSTWSIQQDHTQTAPLGLTSPGTYPGLGLVWFMLTLTRRHSVSGLSGRVIRSRTRREGLQQPQPQPPQQHEAGLRRGRVPAPLSGHGRPQGAGPLVLALVDSRSPPDVQLHLEVSLL